LLVGGIELPTSVRDLLFQARRFGLGVVGSGAGIVGFGQRLVTVGTRLLGFRHRLVEFLLRRQKKGFRRSHLGSGCRDLFREVVTLRQQVVALELGGVARLQGRVALRFGRADRLARLFQLGSQCLEFEVGLPHPLVEDALLRSQLRELVERPLEVDQRLGGVLEGDRQHPEGGEHDQDARHDPDDLPRAPRTRAEQAEPPAADVRSEPVPCERDDAGEHHEQQHQQPDERHARVPGSRSERERTSGPQSWNSLPR